MTERSPREQEFLDQAREKLSRGMGRRASNADYFDAHHIAHHKAEWQSRPESKKVRNNLIVDGLYRGAHNLLHIECPPVPMPNYQTLQYVAPRLHYGPDIYKRIDRYCDLVGERLHHPKMKPIERDICELSIEAVRMQIPFIQDGTTNPKRSIIV